MFGPMCDGEGQFRPISDMYIMRGFRLPDRHYVFCGECGKLLMGRVARGTNGMRWAVVPSHARKRLVVTVRPREEYL